MGYHLCSSSYHCLCCTYHLCSSGHHCCGSSSELCCTNHLCSSSFHSICCTSRLCSPCIHCSCDNVSAFVHHCSSHHNSFHFFANRLFHAPLRPGRSTGPRSST